MKKILGVVLTISIMALTSSPCAAERHGTVKITSEENPETNTVTVQVIRFFSLGVRSYQECVVLMSMKSEQTLGFTIRMTPQASRPASTMPLRTKKPSGEGGEVRGFVFSQMEAGPVWIGVSAEFSRAELERAVRKGASLRFVWNLHHFPPIPTSIPDMAERVMSTDDLRLMLKRKAQ